MIFKHIVFIVALVCGLTPGLAQQPTPVPSPQQGAAAIMASTNSMDVLDDQRALSARDRVNFRVVEDRDPPITLQISDSGELEVPMLGRVKASGKTCKQVAQAIKGALEKSYYNKATVIIGLESISSDPIGRIYITGQVANQGPIEIPRDEELTVSRAILRAGGFADFANRRRVRLMRKGQNGGPSERIIVDVKDVLEKGRFEKDVVVRPGDVIVVPERAINF